MSEDHDTQDIASSETAHGSIEEHQDDHRQPAWRNLIENFTLSWYTICMDSGILAIILHQLPYHFEGIGVLAAILYVFDLVLFVTFTCIQILRVIMFPRTVKHQLTSNISELSMLGSLVIAFLTITALTGLIPSQAHWGGHGFSLLAYVMWWIGTVCMLTVCCAASIIVFEHDLLDDRNMTTAIMIPVVGIATDALVGSLICVYADDVSGRLAVPVIIVGYFLLGMAIWLGLIMYAIFFHRLMASGWPEGPQLPSLIILAGPFGQTASASLNLGAAALTKFGDYNKGTFLNATSGLTVSTFGVVLALLLLGLDYFMIIIALYGVLRGAFKRQLSYNLMWWGTIFPLGTTCVAWLSLSMDMNSPTFRTICTGLFLILLIAYFINWGFTIYYCIWGDLLIKRPKEESQEKSE